MSFCQATLRFRASIGASAIAVAISSSTPAWAEQPVSQTPEHGGTSATPPNQLNDAPAAASQSGLADIVVTARKSRESAQRVPIAITTVTTQTLKDLSVHDIADIQKVTPGLFIASQNSGGRAKIEIRGQTEADSRLSTDSSIGVYVDGVNIPRDYGLRASMVDLAQIEVLKGPQGTLFGKNTTGGAFNITTQRPTYDLGGYIDGVYGSFNNRQLLGVINLPIVDDKVALRLVGQRVRRDGYGQIFNGQDVGDENTWYGRALLRIDPVEPLHILLSADYVKQNNNGTNFILTHQSMLTNGNSARNSLGEIAKELGLDPDSGADRLTAYNTYLSYFNQYGNQYGQKRLFQDGLSNENLYDDLKHYGFSANISYDFGGIVVRSITSYRRLTHAFNQDFDGTPFAIYATILTAREKNLTQEFQVSSIDDRGLDWQLGGYYSRETGNEFNSNDTLRYVNTANASVIDTDVVNASRAVYGQAVYHFTSNLRVTGGVRYTHDSRRVISYNRLDSAYALPPGSLPSVNNCFVKVGGGSIDPATCRYNASVGSSKATWLASVDWSPTPSLMLYASVSRGYRAGGFSIQGAAKVPSTQSALDAAFTPYLPEVVTSYEIGEKGEFFDHHLRLNMSLYYENYRNIQTRVQDVINGNPITLIRNAASAHPYGAEADATARVTSRWTLSAGGSYLHAKFSDYFAKNANGDLVDLSSLPFAAPKWQYNLNTSYDLPVPDGSVRFSLNWNYVSTTNLNPANLLYQEAVSQPGHGLLDGRIAWNFDPWKLNIALFSKNLANKHYISSATGAETLGYTVGFPGDPRTFGVQIRKTL